MASTLSTLAAVARALATLVSELLLGSSRLPPSRLSGRPRAVSHAQAHSTRCGELRAFVDGSVLADGRMGLAVFYARGHPSNFHGGFDAAPAAGVEPTQAGLQDYLKAVNARPTLEFILEKALRAPFPRGPAAPPARRREK